jgi:hypothetical protein
MLQIVFAENTCQEGCGEPVGKGRRFKQGHDARLKSVLYKAIRDEETALEYNGERTAPAALITKLGWPQPAPKKARKAKATPVEETPVEETAKPKRTRKAKAAAPAA